MNRDFSQNKLYRYTMFLPITAFRIMRKLIYQFSDDSKELRMYKDRYMKKRCFIIGNGPSLNVDDLEKLKSELTFATNRIYNIFGNTDWRPTFYVAIDNNVIKDNLQEIRKVTAEHKFLNVTSKVYGMTKSEDVTFINIFGPYLIKPFSYITKKVGRDVSKSFTLSYSVTGVAIELAMYMGFTEIYIIGVDNNYSISINKNGIVHKDKTIKDYFGSLESKPYSIQYTDATNSYYNAFQKYATVHGIKIYNATRGGKLDAYPRIDFDHIELRK